MLPPRPAPRYRTPRGFVEQDEQREEAREETREASGVTRSQNVVLALPHDWHAIGQFLTPALDRVDAAAGGTQLLVLTSDGEATVAIAEAAARTAGAPRAVPVTSARRAERLIRAQPAPVVVGTPAEVATLVRGAALKLDSLRALVVAWADEMLESVTPDELETVMIEVPKEASRTLVTTTETEAVAAFVERYMRRARRVGGGAATEEGAPVALQYVSVAPLARPAALRRLLDEIDPPSAVVVTRASESHDEVRGVLRALGYGDEDPAVRVSQGDVAEHAALVVLYDLPATRGELERAVRGAPVQVVALAQPRQLGHLRAIAGGRVTAFTLADTAAKARGREERLRSELRAVLATGVPSRELIALEPLLAEYDGIEIAAAALRLAERERDRARSVQAGTHTGFTPKGGTAAAAAAPSVGDWKRIFMTVGEIDGVTRGDIVGAITGEGGIASDRVGKVELRENHTLVEIAAADVERVAERMNGATIRGRRIVARLDQDRASREGAGAGGRRPERGERPPRKFDRDGGERRPPRSADRGERSDRAPRTDRAPRGGGRFDRDDRAPRGGGAGGFSRGAGGRARDDRDDRPGRRPGPAEREEWANRADRLRNARRPRRDEG
jgi:ATP-dependent RNA helicase DeaD